LEAVVPALLLWRVAGDDLELAVAQARRDLEVGQRVARIAQAGGEFGLRRSPQPNGVLADLLVAGQGGGHDGIVERRRPHALQLARGPGEHEHRRPVASSGPRYD